MDELTTALTGNITTTQPELALIYGSLIGLAFFMAVAGLILRKVRGQVR